MWQEEEKKEATAELLKYRDSFYAAWTKALGFNNGAPATVIDVGEKKFYSFWSLSLCFVLCLIVELTNMWYSRTMCMQRMDKKVAIGFIFDLGINNGSFSVGQ